MLWLRKREALCLKIIKAIRIFKAAVRIRSLSAKIVMSTEMLAAVKRSEYRAFLAQQTN